MTVFQIFHCITCINLSLCQRQFLNPCFRTKIYFLQVQPKHIRCQSRFEIIHFILLIGDRTPAGRRNIRLLRRVNTKWHRNITHHTQYTGNCNFCISSLRNGMNVERSPNKAVTRTICSRYKRGKRTFRLHFPPKFGSGSGPLSCGAFLRPCGGSPCGWCRPAPGWTCGPAGRAGWP